MPLLDIQQIRDILPHRYPMLLVDAILELEEERIVGIKNVTVNEPFFVGHFPDVYKRQGVRRTMWRVRSAAACISARWISAMPSA